MHVFDISVLSGHIVKVAAKVLKIAQENPEDTFFLRFNNVSIRVDPSDTVDTITENYDNVRQGWYCGKKG